MRLQRYSCLLLLAFIYSWPCTAAARQVHCPDLAFVTSSVESLDTVQYVKEYQIYHVFTLLDSLSSPLDHRNWYMVTTIPAHNFNDAYTEALGTVTTLTQQVDVTPRADDLGYYICEYRGEQRSVYLLSEIYRHAGHRQSRFQQKLAGLQA